MRSRPMTSSPRTAAKIGYPVVVKAVAGGGGKGMRVVEAPEDLRSRHPHPRGPRRGRRSATRASISSDESRRPRHIEIQLLGDHHGMVMPFVERECSIQRRHQKVVEESPSIAVGAALRAADGRGGRGGGAVGRLHERRYDRVPARRRRLVLLSGNEHPAPGRAPGDGNGDERGPRAMADSDRTRRSRSTSIPRERLTAHGHAIECRIYAEDPDAGLHAVARAGPRPPAGLGSGRSRRRRA